VVKSVMGNVEISKHELQLLIHPPTPNAYSVRGNSDVGVTTYDVVSSDLYVAAIVVLVLIYT
jgi:hypothetical protein